MPRTEAQRAAQREKDRAKREKANLELQQERARERLKRTHDYRAMVLASFQSDAALHRRGVAQARGFKAGLRPHTLIRMLERCNVLAKPTSYAPRGVKVVSRMKVAGVGTFEHRRDGEGACWVVAVLTHRRLAAPVAALWLDAGRLPQSNNESEAAA